MPKRRRRAYHARQAEAIYQLQMREAAIRLKHAGKSDAEIARLLGQTVATIRRYRKQSMDRAIERYVAPPDEDTTDPTRNHVPPRGPGPGPHRPNSGKAPTEILDPPDVVALRKACVELRKAALPFDEIATRLGISEAEARRYTFEALKHLQESEVNTAELERRLMVEQLDQMIAGIHAEATGLRPDLDSGGSRRTQPVLEAIDRMLRLMKQKADLLGLNQAPAVDIMTRLRMMAEESQYDLIELQDIARTVLERHKLHLPAYHVDTDAATFASGEEPHDPEPVERVS